MGGGGGRGSEIFVDIEGEYMEKTRETDRRTVVYCFILILPETLQKKKKRDDDLFEPMNIKIISTMAITSIMSFQETHNVKKDWVQEPLPTRLCR